MTTEPITTSTIADLDALLAESSRMMHEALSYNDLTTLGDIALLSASLMRLCVGSTAWDDPARAHIAVSRPLVNAIRRRIEER
jgi:hypothetical protein